MKTLHSNLMDFQLQKHPSNPSSSDTSLLYQNQPSKALIQDHYISKLFYFQECDKVFVVS
jgi:hypothetical protein